MSIMMLDQQHLIFILCLTYACHGSSSASLRVDTKEIAPNVRMPVMSIGVGGLEHQDAHDIVANWLGLGGTGIDTALNYNNQEQVQQAMAESGVAREDLFLTTKIPDCNVSNTVQNIEKDLILLDTSYIDLLLIHGPRNGNCVESWKILETFYRSNKTRAIGVRSE